MTVEIVVDVRDGTSIDEERLRRLSVKTLSDEGVQNGELSVVFLDEKTMRDLNLKYRSRDSSTDVLSFKIDDPAAEEEVVLLGDVVVCPQVARRNADRLGLSLQSELEHLVVHGILHILGYEHGEGTGHSMRNREKEILQSFEFSERERD